ncbi:Arginine--tRNA ligase [bioreactor metagenome]|uniref:arginine--tRNA ligase n=1 Tax=bioreactor metagenome TaxID=1076179 RepID=A0A645IAJ2_9ZZZZ
MKTPGKVKLFLLTEKEETDLIGMLAAFPEEIRTAALTYDPSRITRYAIDLASCFHKFYNAHRVNCEDHALRDARVVLCNCVRIVIQNALTVLSVTAPERM